MKLLNTLFLGTVKKTIETLSKKTNIIIFKY